MATRNGKTTTAADVELSPGRLDGIMGLKDLALALHVSESTLRDLGIPHVRLTRSSRIYFPDEVVAWLRAQERSL